MPAAISAALLETIDRAMTAERLAALAMGPGRWRARLEVEAVRRLHEDFGVPRVEAEHELQLELAQHGDEAERALEEIVFAQRLGVAMGDAPALARALVAPGADRDGGGVSDA